MTWRWPWQKALTGTAEVIGALDQGWSPIPLLGGGGRARVMETFQTAKTANYAWMYSKSPAVRSVIDTIVRNVGQLDLRLYEEVDDAERQPAYGHPAALSMRYPSETVPSDQFVRTLFRDYLTSADAVAIITLAGGDRLNFKWVPISRVEFLGSGMFDVDTYRIHNQLQGTFVDFPADRILHWRGENPNDPRVGLSHLETLRNLIAEDAAMQAANVELAKSGLTEPTWIYRPLEAPAWSNDAAKGFEQDVYNRLQRRNKMPVVLEEGMELRPYGVSPKDAQALDLRKWIKGQIADEYGVPRAMVGLEGDLEQARAMFYTDTLPPYCEEFTKMLNLRLLVRVYGNTDLCWEFNLDEKHMGDDRITSLVSATGRAVMTTNEGRARLNLPPIDTGDDLVTPLNVLVGDNPKPSPMVMGPQQPGEPPQDGSAPQKALTQFHPRRSADIERQHGYVDQAKGELMRFYRRQHRSLGSKASVPFDSERWNRELSADLNKLLSGIVETEGGIYVARLLGGNFDMKRVRNYLRAMAEGVAQGLNDVTEADIQRMGVDDAMARAMGGQRVDPASASIAGNATRFARVSASEQSPGHEHRMKTWVADTARHAEFDGETVGIGEQFSAGFEPGSAPNCRCSMTIS
jgi:HK97 family phage portal protein